MKANQGAAGVDGQSIADFEIELKNNLYKLWNRLSSGSGTLALAGISHLSFSLHIGATGSRVPQKSLIWIHATSKPDAAGAGLQGSAQTRPRGHYLPPGFDIIL